ncbi:aluminum-activated malate transporter 1-like [Carex rostrata]
MFSAFVDPLGPDLQTNEFATNIKSLIIAYGLIIFLTWCLSFFAGDEVHYRVQEIINDLADIFKELDQKCFGQNSVYKILQDGPFLELLQSLINSKEKEKSLSKFLCWELRWHPHPQEQYENIGDLIRHWAFSIPPLSTTVENLHLITHLRETCKEICSESAKVLALLSDSMKNKTAPAA